MNPINKKIFGLVASLLGLHAACWGQTGLNLFDDTFLHRIEFVNADTLKFMDATLKDVYQNVGIKIDNQSYISVGLSTKGDKSFSAAPNNKKPFKVKMDKYVSGVKYDGIKRFNLNNSLYDNSFIREKLTFDAAARIGVASPRIAFAEVYVNGIYWGVYSIVEAQDEIYKRVYGNDNGVTMETVGSALQLTTLRYYGSSESDYGGLYDVDKGDPAVAWPLWLLALDKLNNTADGGSYIGTVSAYFDFASFFKFNAVLDYNLNAEPKNRNQIFYRDVTTQKFYNICWDQNVAFPEFLGSQGTSIFPQTTAIAILDKYSLYPEFAKYYNDALCSLRSTIFATQALDTKIATLRGIIDNAVRADNRKGFSYDDYVTSFEHLKQFVAIRSQKAEEFLASQNYSCEASGILSPEDAPDIVVYPNPADNELYLSGLGNESVQYQICYSTGHVVQEGTVGSSSMINISSLPRGLFLINLFSKDKRFCSKKIVKN